MRTLIVDVGNEWFSVATVEKKFRKFSALFVGLKTVFPKKCCMGICLYDFTDLTVEEMDDVSTAKNLSDRSIEKIPQDLLWLVKDEASVGRLVELNDHPLDISNSERMQEIEKIFAKHDIEIQWVNVPEGFLEKVV